MNVTRGACLRAWLAALGWMALIFWLSAQPTLPDLGPDLTDIQDIVGHFVAYFGLAFWLIRALRRTPAVRHPRLWTFLLALAYALSDELHQSFVPNRHADPFDVLVDLTGVVAFLVFDFGFWRVWRAGGDG